MEDECTLKKLFDYLYPTDMTFEYHSNSEKGKYIKIVLYNDLYLSVYPYTSENYEVVKHDYSAYPKDITQYWSYKDLVEYLRINYEG